MNRPTKRVEYLCGLFPGWQDGQSSPYLTPTYNATSHETPKGGLTVKVIVDLPEIPWPADMSVPGTVEELP